jgi:uncharacterized protein (DUF2141 family)
LYLRYNTMFKILLIVILFSGFISNRFIYAQSGYSLELEIKGIRSEKGKIFFQLFDQEKNVLKEIVADIQNGKSILRFPELKPGQYAFRYFHDENNNGKLDKNMLGVPREGFGFSNDPPIVIGEPSFDKWLFDLKEQKKMNSAIKYF